MTGETKTYVRVLACLLAIVGNLSAVETGRGSVDTGVGWLRGAGRDQPVSEVLSKHLKSLNGQVRPLICAYDEARLVGISGFNRGSFSNVQSRWSCAVESTPTSGDSSALDFKVAFKLDLGTVEQSGVAVAFDFFNWSTTNYVFAPAMLYGGNRFRILPIGYPPYIHDPKQRPLEMPITVTDILHLNADEKPGLVEMKTFNCATPMMGFHDPRTKRGFLVVAEPSTSLGVSGMIIQEDPADQRASFVISAPGVRTSRYRLGGRAGSGDRGVTWKAGDEMVLKFRLYNFPAHDLAAFFAKAFEVRKALTGSNVYRNVTPYSAAAEMLATHHDLRKWHEGDKYGYYSNGPKNESPFAHQIGWNGIPIYSHAAFLNASSERLRRGCLSLDALIPAQGKSGLFYAMCRDGEIFGDTFSDQRKRHSISMIRRTGDVLYFGLQQLEILRHEGHADMIKPEWEAMFRRSADGLVKLYDTYGQFGQFVDADTGVMDINGSTAGAGCIPGLALASKYFKEPKYLKTAEKAGQLYYTRDLSHGYSGGGPAEILQAPDSESTFNLCLAYMVLHDVTGKEVWLNYAREATHMLATWTVSYDYVFPPDSDFGRTGVKATGSIFASSQNNHSAPGLYIHSGDFLLKLYRATGDKGVAELYKDMVHNVVQYLNTRDNPIMPDAPEGFATERVQLSDWEGNDFGQVPSDSNLAWESLIEFTCLQNPGIYLNTDTGRLLVLDHVEAIIEKQSRNGITLKISNPTPHNAQVAIFAEKSVQAKEPFDCTACLKWPKVGVKAGETVRVRVSRNGQVAVQTN